MVSRSREPCVNAGHQQVTYLEYITVQRHFRKQFYIMSSAVCNSVINGPVVGCLVVFFCETTSTRVPSVILFSVAYVKLYMLNSLYSLELLKRFSSTSIKHACF